MVLNCPEDSTCIGIAHCALHISTSERGRRRTSCWLWRVASRRPNDFLVASANGFKMNSYTLFVLPPPFHHPSCHCQRTALFLVFFWPISASLSGQSAASKFTRFWCILEDKTEAEIRILAVVLTEHRQLGLTDHL